MLERSYLVMVGTSLALAVGVLAAVKLLAGKKILLEKGKKKRVKIQSIEKLSHDTKRYRLDLGSKSTKLGLPTGKHIHLYCPNPEGVSSGKWNGKDDPDKGKSEIHRAYTPTTGDNVCGYTDLVIKTYRPGTFKMPDGREMVWEDGGKMGKYLDSLKVGDSIEIGGPTGLVEYTGSGTFKLSGGRTATASKVAMMAGGTGLTPMYQIVMAALADPADKCEFALLYANKTEDDILIKDMLDAAAESSKGRFKVHYTLDFPPEGWTGQKGFITQDMIKAVLPPPGPETLVCMCGPPPMVQYACKQNLEALGYERDRWVIF